MKSIKQKIVVTISVFLLGMGQANAVDPAPPLAISQDPMFLIGGNVPPMNMIVMGRDHSLFYQAYNDASDLTGDGVPDVGYKPDQIDYYGLFDSFKCYSYTAADDGRFQPIGPTGTNKTCGSGWSGDFLNWVTTSRIDALRKVLYGGSRHIDDQDLTVLARSYIPQDAHSWGKEYQSIERDGYDIAQYTPLSQPSPGNYHLFANTSLTGSPNRPRMRVLRNTGFRVWEWVAIERPVAGARCLDGGSGPQCTSDADGMDDYTVRVEVCKQGMLEPNCQRYPNGAYKPVGLLQDFGETGRMHFGLLSGSYLRNMSGGVLRRNMSVITDEIEPQTGQFTGVQGIIRTIDSFKIVGFRSGHDYHPGWPNAWLVDRTMDEGEFPDWGNPIGEMVYETVRYFAGRDDPTPAFVPPLNDNREHVTAHLGDDLSLPVDEWDDPYATRPWCTQAAQLIISNTNISFDGDNMPGSAFSGFSGDLPGFNAAQLGDEIWNLEVGASRPHFIGQVGNFYDGAPSVKMVSGLGNIRGLSPQEPTREGTYYSASAARFGAFTDDLRPDIQGSQNLETFSVALASQLPRIEFPIGNNLVTMVPFGKSVATEGGCGGLNVPTGAGNFQPMAQIVDFFVEQWVNTDPSNEDQDVNDGRPFASFRINFEDVEQAADHDMDAIVNYQIAVTEGGGLEVKLTPEYYAGCIKMNVGYVISGVEADFNDPILAGQTVRGPADGLYLDIRGDADVNTDVRFFLNTPPGLPPGACAATPISPQYADACNSLPGLPPGNMEEGVTRTFYPSGASAATVLRDPLWWAAKYGNTANQGLAPGQTPDNYFLVTNAATLADQLAQAFEQILSLADRTSVTTESSRVREGSFLYRAEFNSEDWSGEIKALDPFDLSEEWSANAAMPSTRRLFASSKASNGDTDGVTFGTGLAGGSDVRERIVNPVPANFFGPNFDANDVSDGNKLLAFLAGSSVDEGDLFRERGTVIGDIISSELKFSGAVNEGWVRLSEQEGGQLGAGSYAEYADCKKQDPRNFDSTGTCTPQRYSAVFVGSNGGMLHAFDAENGEELFGFIPRAVQSNLWRLARKDYAESGQKRAFVDGQVEVRDAYDGSQWRTILVGGLGAGGRSVYALDVSTPQSFNANDVLWEITAEEDPRIGHVYERPRIVRLENTSGQGQWVAIFGNGYNADGGKGHLFVVDLFSGEPLQVIDVPPTTVTTGQGNNAVTTTLSSGLSAPGVLSTPTGLFAQAIYAGDIAGNMWRFEVNGHNIQSPQKLFSDPDRRPITSAPTLARSAQGFINVFFGTGKLFEIGDATVDPDNEPVQRFYALRDQGNEIVVGDLGARELVMGPNGRRINISSDDTDGWYLPFALGSDGNGERVVRQARIAAGRLLIRTYEPDDDPCLAGGIVRDYPLDAISGVLVSTSQGELDVLERGGTPSGGSSPVIFDPPTAPGTRPVPALPDLEPGVTPTDISDAETDRGAWCPAFGFFDLDGNFVRLGTICDGRQTWRQIR